MHAQILRIDRLDKIAILAAVNLDRTIYWFSTILMCLIFAFSAGMYLTKYDMVKGFFEELSYPTYLIYPLAIAKILGIIAILSNKSQLLKEWAYAGFFFDSTLAILGHYYAGHGFGLSVVAFIAVFSSRIYDYKLSENPTR